MINVLAILSGIMLIAPAVSLIVELFDKVNAGNYFFHYALTFSLPFAVAGPNAVNPFLGDCFVMGMGGIFICLTYVTIYHFDPVFIAMSQPVDPVSRSNVYRQPYKPTPPSRRLKKIAVRSTVGWVYLLRSSDDLYKIGRTANPNNRIRTFNVKLPFDVEYEHLIYSDNMFALERELHHRFAVQRVGGEWFNLSPEDVEYIKSL